MVAQVEPKIYTPEEYLELEVNSSARHEYIKGAMIPMTGGTPTHNQISGNLYIALTLALRSKAYQVFHVDQRLWIPEASIYTYPDVMVTPKPYELQIGRRDTVMNPYLIAEVLSDSTQNYDRGEKFLNYRTMPDFCEYLLIDQYRVYVEHYVKTAANQWLLTEHNSLTERLALRLADLQIQIADLYEGVEFDQPAT
jgi:Uma2 family endonuclease